MVNLSGRDVRRQISGVAASRADDPLMKAQQVGRHRTGRDDVAFDRAWQEGRALTIEQAIELALEEAVERP